jgi:hypothetical protein
MPNNSESANRAITAELETLVLKALEKNPADRHATTQELANDLHRFVVSVMTATPREG